MDIYQYQKMMKGRNSNRADAFSGNSFNPLNSYPDRKPVSQYSTGFDNAFGTYNSKLSKDQNLKNAYQRMSNYGLNNSNQGIEGRNKLNAINAQKNLSYAEQSNLDNMAGITVGQFGDYTRALNQTNQGSETNWWDTIGQQLGSEGALGGLKGWLDLGVQGINAYTGLQQVSNARDQNKLARETFGFQKAAWNKDYGARKLAYNENANMRNDWKRAQQGGPGNYTMDTLIA